MEYKIELIIIDKNEVELDFIKITLKEKADGNVYNYCDLPHAKDKLGKKYIVKDPLRQKIEWVYISDGKNWLRLNQYNYITKEELIKILNERKNEYE